MGRTQRGTTAADHPPKKEKMTPKKVAKKTTAKKGAKGGRKKKGTESYKIYIYKVLKQVHPDTWVSSKSMSIMNSFTNDIFEKIASEASPRGARGCAPPLLLGLERLHFLLVPLLVDLRLVLVGDLVGVGHAPPLRAEDLGDLRNAHALVGLLDGRALLDREEHEGHHRALGLVGRLVRLHLLLVALLVRGRLGVVLGLLAVVHAPPLLAQDLGDLRDLQRRVGLLHLRALVDREVHEGDHRALGLVGVLGLLLLLRLAVLADRGLLHHPAPESERPDPPAPLPRFSPC